LNRIAPSNQDIQTKALDPITQYDSATFLREQFSPRLPESKTLVHKLSMVEGNKLTGSSGEMNPKTSSGEAEIQSPIEPSSQNIGSARRSDSIRTKNVQSHAVDAASQSGPTSRLRLRQTALNIARSTTADIDNESRDAHAPLAKYSGATAVAAQLR